MRKLMLPLLVLSTVIPLLAASNATIDQIGTGTFQPMARGRLDDYAQLQATHPKDLGTALATDLGGATIALTDKTPFVFEAHPYYSVVFVATPPGTPDPKIYRLLLHVEGKNSAEVVDHLPGITDFLEVFLSEDPDAAMDSVFSSAPVENPLQGQALKAVKFTETALAGLVGAVQKPATIQAAKTAARSTPLPPPITVTLRSVHIVDMRSTVSVNTIVSPVAEVDRPTLDKAVSSTQEKLQRTRTLISKCAEDLATHLATKAADDLKLKASSDVVDAAERKSIRDDLKRIANDDLQTGYCVTDRAAPNAEARIAAINETQAAFLDLFTPDDKPLTSSDSFSDTPLSHLDLGVAAGAMLRIRGAQRAKLNDAGNAVADPLSGLLSMAVLHWHPVAFNMATATPTAAERGSVLLGFIVSPEPGLAAGVSWSIFRGLNVHVSHDWMLVHEKSSDTALRRGWARAITVGFGYNFE